MIVKCGVLVLFATLSCGLQNGLRNIEHHPAWQVLARYECGESAADRIIGGLDAALGQFPWIVRLGYTTSNLSPSDIHHPAWSLFARHDCEDNAVDCIIGGFDAALGQFAAVDEPEPDWMCGGVLITDRHVVTAAHCLANLDIGYSLSYIRIGEYNTETNPDCQIKVCAPAVQDRKPKIIRRHPLFNKPSFHNDIAMIQLDIPVQLHDYVAPVCLPSTLEQRAPQPLGAPLTVAGWGKINMTTEERARILQYVSIPIVDPETCNMFGGLFKMSASQICAGAQRNKDACGGDSGGPVMKVFDGPEGPKTYLVGVVSFGPTICGIKKPGVYSSIPLYLDWILDNLLEMT